MNNQTLNNGLSDKLIKDIVAADFKTASVFEKYGIDFCCKGNRPLSAACEEKGIDTSAVLSEISSLSGRGGEDSNRYELWEPDYLIQHIINNHHKYIESSVPVISAHLEKVVRAHGSRHPYVAEVRDLFFELVNELLSHMQKEERVLFPLINRVQQFAREGARPEGGIMSVQGPISVMENEHSNAGGILERIRTITDDFNLPADACNTFAVTYGELEEFEQDLHKHIFLENSILFPKAIALEEELAGAR